jgi:hypothetical protein
MQQESTRSDMQLWKQQEQQQENRKNSSKPLKKQYVTRTTSSSTTKRTNSMQGKKSTSISSTKLHCHTQNPRSHVVQMNEWKSTTPQGTQAAAAAAMHVTKSNNITNK